ncbi:MAG: type II toxin-antitoxin system VapC family toxin [Lentisphaerae bacterium]|nr:type II toxin-antitoxin system VapC family toxin [Lentisphaerota bacterium]
MYLLDTNIWLERLLEQERAAEVSQLLATVPGSELAITDFAFHSIGVIMLKLGKPEELIRFADDLVGEGEVALVSLEPHDTHAITDAATAYRLDFDDAYQYTAAEKYGLQLISFDDSFDRTPRRRKTPGDVVQL